MKAPRASHRLGLCPCTGLCHCTAPPRCAPLSLWETQGLPQCLEFSFELLSCLRSYKGLNGTDGGQECEVMFKNYQLLSEVLLVCWRFLGVFVLCPLPFLKDPLPSALSFLLSPCCGFSSSSHASHFSPFALSMLPRSVVTQARSHECQIYLVMT